MLVGAGSGGGGGFEVHLPTLGTVCGELYTDAGGVGSVGTTTTGGVDDAAGACGGPLLAGALGRLSAALEAKCAALGTAVDGAGTTLRASAATYTGADAGAAAGLGRLDLSADAGSAGGGGLSGVSGQARPTAPLPVAPGWGQPPRPGVAPR